MTSIEFVTVSGNLLCQLAGHLLQFPGQNMNKYSNAITDFSITMNLKSKLIE